VEELDRKSLEIMTEEERIRRLHERMARDPTEGSELAREQRAKNLAAGIKAHIGEGSGSEGSPSVVSNPPSRSASAARSFDPKEQKKWPPPAYEQRKDVFDELAAALEAISVKGIIDFRNITVVPKLVEDVAVSVLACVAHVDDASDDDKVPPKSWPAVQKVMAKPGHLINALRRYPYAVDAMRVQAADVKSAEKVLERTFRVTQLEDVHPVAGMLYRWMYAAAHYFRLRITDKAQSAQGMKPSAVPKQSFGPPRRSASAATLGAAGASAAPAPPGAATRPAPGARGMAARAGSPVPSGLPKGPSAPTTPGRTGPPPRGVGGGRLAPKPGSPAPGSAVPGRTSPLPPKRAPPTPGSTHNQTVPHVPPGAIDMEAFRRELEATRKEVLKLKQAEADMQWKMDRENRKDGEEAKKALDQDLMEWRWQQVEAGKDIEHEKELMSREKRFAENLETVEFKRQVRAAEKEHEHKEILEQLESTMENVNWQEHVLKERQEQEKKVLDDKIEDKKAIKEVLVVKAQREKDEIERTREEEKTTVMDFERRKLLEELERLRQSVGIVQNAYERRKR